MAGTRAADLLELVHERPGLNRTDAARALQVGTGAVTEIVSRLVAAGLIIEHPAPPTGSRGRPTRVLTGHPSGPLVLAVSITFRSWRAALIGIGGLVTASATATHQNGSAATMRSIARATDRLRGAAPGPVVGVGVSVPGVVVDGTLVQASYLGWTGVDLAVFSRAGEITVAGNDASLAGSAESRRGRAAGFDVALHLRLEAGLGGAILDHGQITGGSLGAAGEFGHMPFGDPDALCPCGAHGCWGDAIDGRALARILGETEPADQVRYFRDVLDRAGRANPELRAIETIAARLGRGIAGLVNGLDPGVVTVGGLGAALLDRAPVALQTAYLGGLMNFRRADPPAVLAAELGEDGPLIGAAEQTWTRLWDRLVRD